MVDFSHFKALKFLSLDLYLISSFINLSPCAPLNLEVLHLISYIFDEWNSSPHPEDWNEEKDLNTLLTAKEFPKLREVIVLAKPVTFRKRIGTSETSLDGHRKARRVFQENSGFQNGRANLSTL